MARFAGLVGQKRLAVTLTRDELARAARSDATLRALASDLACFARYCRLEGLTGLPAAHESVARYVERLWQTGPLVEWAELGQGRQRLSRPVKPASITRRLASIVMLHRLLHRDNLCREANVRHAMTIARKSVGTSQKQAAPTRLAAAQQSAEQSGSGGRALHCRVRQGCFAP
jgi:site-specific recombinase XerD